MPGRTDRARLAAWLTSPENPFFAKSLVNRVWFHLMGRGIVEPVDDFRDSNPASNDELLDGLTAAIRQERLQSQGPDPDDPPQPHLPALSRDTTS